jgi:hypothetical protein
LAAEEQATQDPDRLLFAVHAHEAKERILFCQGEEPTHHRVGQKDEVPDVLGAKTVQDDPRPRGSVGRDVTTRTFQRRTHHEV